MSTKREKQYQCVFSSGAGEFSYRVSAWTPEAAGELFREALARAGIQGPGRIRVSDLRGTLAREENLAPPSMHA
jgi:hypothetical protein